MTTRRNLILALALVTFVALAGLAMLAIDSSAPDRVRSPWERAGAKVDRTLDRAGDELPSLFSR